jgi:hypothetical protein
MQRYFSDIEANYKIDEKYAWSDPVGLLMNACEQIIMLHVRCLVKRRCDVKICAVTYRQARGTLAQKP